MIGETLSERWVIKSKLASSGQSTTYRAEDISGEYYHAVVKLFHETQYPTRISQEVAVLQSINHNRVLQFLDAGEYNGRYWLATPYCSGGNLDNCELDVFRDSRFVFDIFRHILEGMVFLHTRKPIIVHRDIKPPNILLRSERGPALIADFGICFLEGTSRHTRSNEPVGDRMFIAPELEEGRLENVLPTSDVYSLGKLLYWMLSGKKIFTREKHRSPEWNLVKKFGNPRFEHFNKLLDRMIEFDPKNRMKDAISVTNGFEEAVRLYEGNYNPIGKDVKQKCTYCGIGEYKHIEIDPPFRGYDWLTFACEHCGHTQVFRTRGGKRYPAWER